MTDQYRRPRSPVYNPARASLPINLPGHGHPASHNHQHHHHDKDHDHHVRVIPTSRRELIPTTHSRNGSSTASSAGTVTTTYKITADPPPASSRSSSARNASRTRSSTVDSYNRPTIVTPAASRNKPVIHSGRPPSPLRNPYRLSDEDYYSVPASSQHLHSRNKRYSATMDNDDMRRLEMERERDRLRVPSARERGSYSSSRPRPVYPKSAARHLPTFGDDYSEDGYGYTKPRDLVQYDLDNPTRQEQRRDSFESGGRSRPTSVGNYGELVVGSYDSRMHGPPPSIRGFDKFSRGSTWEQPMGRMPVAPPPPVSPIHRPARVDPPFEEQPPKRSYPRRPVYPDHEHKRGPRNDYYEVQDDDPRGKRERPYRATPGYGSPVEQRGFGIRDELPQKLERSEKSDRLDRAERHERPERKEKFDRLEREKRPERPERVERSDRLDKTDRIERGERSERPERPDDDLPEHNKGRDAVAAGLGIAGAAVGLNAAKKAKDDHDDRDDRKQKEYYDDPRPSRNQREAKDRVDLDGREPKERPAHLSEQRDADDLERRRRHKHRREAPSSGTDSESDPRPEKADIPQRREPRPEQQSSAAPTAFNPRDTMDLRALKEALNSKDNSVPTAEPTATRSPRPSATKGPVEAAKIRTGLDSERRSREAFDSKDNPHARVVSPPRPKSDEKPVKGILRAPREKFPEDLAPIREGVAPLKDAKRDGVPSDARWTKISRKLVNPEALELGKERYEARDDFVIVLRVLSRDEVQGYAEVTQKLRAAREEAEEQEARSERRRARRERHERHKRERSLGERSERRRRRRDRDSESSDTTDDEDRVYDRNAPKMLEPAPPRRRAASNNFDEPMMSGGLDGLGLREPPDAPGHYPGYTRNPPPPGSPVGQTPGTSRRSRNES
ncbi:uncharacterized protein BP5553_01628 [Venustampulla echinocandica]|uniref:DUF8035 domain-containing protein n=1 Tax=Venustampulla echinocandica TaxID=2656787 RepID=A0A370U1J1_9HELO|nr:uncharacterized protein BP5553_01628 [Venustampulla echinocandica]RDL41649.1 hypothetical protein BP5553_01628 [Venustampulla echinocandica]